MRYLDCLFNIKKKTIQTIGVAKQRIEIISHISGCSICRACACELWIWICCRTLCAIFKVYQPLRKLMKLNKWLFSKSNHCKTVVPYHSLYNVEFSSIKELPSRATWWIFEWNVYTCGNVLLTFPIKFIYSYYYYHVFDIHKLLKSIAVLSVTELIISNLFARNIQSIRPNRLEISPNIIEIMCAYW